MSEEARSSSNLRVKTKKWRSSLSLSDSNFEFRTISSPVSSSDLKLTELGDDLIQLEFVTMIARAGGKQKETFQLDHFYSCIPEFSVASSYYQPNPLPNECELCSTIEPGFPFVIELCLTQVKPSRDVQPDEEASCGVVGCSSADNYDRPCSVWASVNGCKKSIMEPFSTGQWKSEKFHISVSGVEWKPAAQNCVIWMKFPKSVGEINAHRQFADLYVKQSNCDVQFSFEGVDGIGEKIGGHVTILSARSAVFAAMFQNDMKEAKTKQVSIKDIKPEIFKQLLYYIYSGRTSATLTEDAARLLFAAADIYNVQDLKNECARFLLTCVRLDNAINLMAWAHLHSVDKLKEAALTFVALHGKEICQLDDWERLIKNYPDLCLLATRRMWH